MTRQVMKSKRTPEGYVYVMSASNGYVKVGKAGSPYERLCTVRCNSPLPIILSYACKCDYPVDVEEIAHEILAPRRLHREWFDVPTLFAIGALREALVELGQPPVKMPHRQELKKPGGCGSQLVHKADVNEIAGTPALQAFAAGILPERPQCQNPLTIEQLPDANGRPAWQLPPGYTGRL